MATTSEATGASQAEQSEALYEKLRPGPGMAPTEVGAHQRARIYSALIGLVADRGRDAVTVRELTRLANVSSRAFYKHFDGTEECFLRTYELITRRAAKRIVASQAGERDWRKRLHLAFGAFVRELEREPQAARFALVDAYAGGPKTLERVQHTDNIFETMLTESFLRAPDDINVSPLLIKGVVAGVAHVARTRTMTNRTDEATTVGGQLADWALSYHSESVGLLAELDRGSPSHASGVGRFPVPSSEEERGEESRALSDARALILSATAKLAVAEGYGSLTVSRIRAAAGVQPRFFAAHFSGVEDCFLATMELRAVSAVSRAAYARAAKLTWQGGVYRAISSLCGQIASDNALAQLCFADAFAPDRAVSNCRESFVTLIVQLLSDDAPTNCLSDTLRIEAAAGAVWGVLHHQVTSGQSRQLPRIAATLSVIALAPLIGMSPAIEAIHQEQAG
jgi:AcrR family transcriptional regulator